MEQVKQEPYCKTDRLSRWKGIRLLIRWVLGRRALLFHRLTEFIIFIPRIPDRTYVRSSDAYREPKRLIVLFISVGV